MSKMRIKWNMQNKGTQGSYELEKKNMLAGINSTLEIAEENIRQVENSIGNHPIKCIKEKEQKKS